MRALTHAQTHTHTYTQTHIVEHIFISNLHKIWLTWDLWKPNQYVNSGVSECTMWGCDHCSLLLIFAFKILRQHTKLRCIFVTTTVNIQYCFASICVHNISRHNMCQINRLSYKTLKLKSLPLCFLHFQYYGYHSYHEVSTFLATALLTALHSAKA